MQNTIDITPLEEEPPTKPTENVYRKRHASLMPSSSPRHSSRHYFQRRLSVPDLHRLKKEWGKYQSSGIEDLELSKLQVDLLNIQSDIPLKRPLIRVKMGSSKYYTMRSRSPTGDWNEGFVFVVTYHTQLFDTIEFDLYDQPRKRWPSNVKHLGKAKLKLSKLAGKDDIFVTFLPVYEYHIRRSLPAEILDTLQESSLRLKKMVDAAVPPAKLIGSLQIRIRYHFQQPSDVPTLAIAPYPELLQQRGCNGANSIVSESDDDQPGYYSDTASINTASPVQKLSIGTNNIINNNNDNDNDNQPRLSAVDGCIDETGVWPITTFPTGNTLSPPDNTPRNNSTSSQHNRGELAQDEHVVNSLFMNRLSTIMTSQVPCSKQNTINTFQRPNISATSSREGLNSDIDWRQNESRLELHPNSLRSSTTKTRDCQWLRAILWPVNRSKLASNRGRRYGFSQNDADETQSTLPTIRIQDANNNDNANANDNANVDNDRHKGKEKVKEKVKEQKGRIKKGAEKARYIIHSVNFGDKNFGFQWMQDSFEDVAISHPLIDSLVGLVVSGQTRAMVRALIKLANAFGQGFKVTGFQLLKAMLVLQKYYQSLPEPPPEPLIYDRTLVNDSRHYFDYALIAYGWRGLVYLGAYGQYIRGARHRRSNRMAILRYLQIPPEDLLGYEYGLRKGAAFQPSYFLAIDRSRKAIVLSIRGTWSLYDAITDLVCLYKPWKGGLVHSGMLASAQWFYTEIVPQIFRYIHHHRNELSSFIITGHSLGGGAASLLTMMVVDHLEELRDISRNPTFTLRCYSYAPVALSSQQLGSQYDRFIYSFICQDDIVGRLSYGTAMELKELVMDTIGAYETLGGWRKVMYDSETREVCFEIISKRRKQIYNNAEELYPLLYIPGKIIHIVRKREMRFGGNERHKKDGPEAGENRRGKESKRESVSKHIPGASRHTYTMHVGNRAISNEMLVTTKSVEDHMISSYRNAFSQLGASSPS